MDDGNHLPLPFHALIDPLGCVCVLASTNRCGVTKEAKKLLSLVLRCAARRRPSVHTSVHPESTCSAVQWAVTLGILLLEIGWPTMIVCRLRSLGTREQPANKRWMKIIAYYFVAQCLYHQPAHHLMLRRRRRSCWYIQCSAVSLCKEGTYGHPNYRPFPS